MTTTLNRKHPRTDGTKSLRRTRNRSKACPSINTLAITLPKPFPHPTILSVATLAIYKYLLCSYAFSPWPIEQVLSFSNQQNHPTKQQRQQRRLYQQMHRLQQQVLQFEKALESIQTSTHGSHVYCIMLSFGTSFARPRSIYLIDVSCLVNNSTTTTTTSNSTTTEELLEQKEEYAPLARKILRHLLQHEHANISSSSSYSPRQQLFLSIGIRTTSTSTSTSTTTTNATTLFEYPEEWISRRTWNLQHILQTPSGLRPPTICHMKLSFPPYRWTDENQNVLEQFTTWFSFKTTIRPIRE